MVAPDIVELREIRAAERSVESRAVARWRCNPRPTARWIACGARAVPTRRVCSSRAIAAQRRRVIPRADESRPNDLETLRWFVIRALQRDRVLPDHSKSGLRDD